jgi:hypothetical protein
MTIAALGPATQVENSTTLSRSSIAFSAFAHSVGRRATGSD